MAGYMEKKRMEMKRSLTIKRAAIWPLFAYLFLILIAVVKFAPKSDFHKSEQKMSIIFFIINLILIWATTSWGSWYKKKVFPNTSLWKLILQNIVVNSIAIILTIIICFLLEYFFELSLDGELFIILVFLLIIGVLTVSAIAIITDLYFENLQKKLSIEALVIVVTFLVYYFFKW